jgi:hypothetical protein
MPQEQAAGFFGKPRSIPASDRLEAYPTLRRGLVDGLIAPTHAGSLCDFALQRLERCLKSWLLIFSQASLDNCK